MVSHPIYGRCRHHPVRSPGKLRGFDRNFTQQHWGFNDSEPRKKIHLADLALPAYSAPGSNMFTKNMCDFGSGMEFPLECCFGKKNYWTIIWTACDFFGLSQKGDPFYMDKWLVIAFLTAKMTVKQLFCWAISFWTSMGQTHLRYKANFRLDSHSSFAKVYSLGFVFRMGHHKIAWFIMKKVQHWITLGYLVFPMFRKQKKSANLDGAYFNGLV